MQSARILSFFGKSNLKLVTVTNSCTFPSTLEVPILPWPEACLANQRSGNVHYTKAWKIWSHLISVAIPFLHTRSSSHRDGKAMDGWSYYRESLEKFHKQDNNWMEWFDTLGTIPRVWMWLQFSSLTWLTISVDRSARTERGLSFHPRHRPLQHSQCHPVDAASNDHPLVISQYRKYSDRLTPGASQSDKTRRRANRGSEWMAVLSTRVDMTIG